MYAVAGHVGGGRLLAVVVTFGYAAFLAGPAIIGFLVRHLGVHAMAVQALLCAGIVGLAVTMPGNDSDLARAGWRQGLSALQAQTRGRLLMVLQGRTGTAVAR